MGVSEARVSDQLTISGAVDIFFGDLRLAPRSRTTYSIGIRKFLQHLVRHEGIGSRVRADRDAVRRSRDELRVDDRSG
jgi:hypothetical protein